MDPGSGLRLATVATGLAPHEISVAPDGKRAAVSNYGTRDQPGASLGITWYTADRIAVTTEGSQSLLLVDPVAGRVVQAIVTVQETSHMVAVSADTSRAYVANIGSGTTTVIDLATGRKLADLPTGAGSEAPVSPGGRELWVAARSAGEIAVVDTGTLAITARLPAPGMPIRNALHPMAAPHS